MNFKSGFVTIIGRPNVGKSTLLNNLTGEKIAITSNKPQTTRNNIKTIVTKGDYQMVFVDTPGIHKPKTKLGSYMVNAAKNTFDEVDAILYLVEVMDKKPGPGDMHIIDMLMTVKTPVFLIINKIDLSSKKEEILEIINAYKDLLDFKEIIPISAIKNEGTDIILNIIKKVLPEGPKYFPDDQLTDQPERALVAELIREKMLRLLDEEVPHGTGVEVTLFKDNEGNNEKDGKGHLIEIHATIYCEKETHKGIVIGSKGSMLKKIGSMARVEMERLLGCKVYLELWVKVKDDWRNNPGMLRTLGYTDK